MILICTSDDTRLDDAGMAQSPMSMATSAS
jgi:hypothetical protein